MFRGPQFLLLFAAASSACTAGGPRLESEEEPASLTCAPPTAQLALWLRADQLTLAPGGAVAAWPDISGTNNSAAQTMAARRPTFNAAAINGHPAVSFDGVDDRLDLASNLFAPAHFPLTIVAVLRTTDTDAHVAGTGSSAAGYLTSYGGALTLTGGRATVKANYASSGLHLADAAPLTGAPHLVSAVASSGASALFVDGRTAGASSAATNAYPYQKSTIGASDGSISGDARDPFAGELAELLVYRRALPSAERAELERCLADKYGLVLIGCDGVPNSGLELDACGICGGDGSSCAAIAIPGLSLWLRADDLALAHGGAVSAWNDVSGQNNIASQSNSARRPIFESAAAGGHAAVVFDGVDDRLDLATNTFAAGNYPLTVFAVLSTSDNSGHIAGTGSSSPNYLTTYGGALTVVNNAPVIKANSYGSGLHLAGSSPIATNAPRIISAVAKTGSSTLYTDCAIAGLARDTASAYTYGKSTIGASDGSSSNASIDPFAGRISELIVYRRALDEPERMAIEDRLAAKYGLSCTHVLPDPAITLAGSAVLFYKLGESGTAPRADSASGLHVYPFPTDAAGIFAEPGVAGNAQNIDGTAGYHYWRSSHAGMDHHGGSFTWAGWMKLASYYSSQTFVGKWNHDSNNKREYRIGYDLTANRFQFEISATGAVGPGHSTLVTHPATVDLNIHYFIEAWYDAAAQTLNLRIGTQAQRGTIASVPWSGGVHFDNADLNLGAHNTCADAHIHGSLDAVGYWTRTLSEAESLRLWNNGHGFEP